MGYRETPDTVSRFAFGTVGHFACKHIYIYWQPRRCGLQVIRIP
jgi:hypothetical protein